MVVIPELLVLVLTFVLQVYYDYFNDHAYRSTSKGKEITVPAELHQIPLFIRGGSIIPTRERPRRSSPLMKRDPFTLRVALSTDGSARGELYLDDGESLVPEATMWVDVGSTPSTPKLLPGHRYTNEIF